MGAGTPWAAVPRSQARTAQQAELQERAAGSWAGCSLRDLPCQLYLDSLLPAVPAPAGWQLPRGMAADGPAGPVATAVLGTTVQSP